MLRILWFLSLCWPLSGYSQFSFDASKLTQLTDSLVREIEKTNIVMGEAVGMGGERPEQYDHFIALKNNARDEELIALSRHPNPCVRCYAVWALADRASVPVLPILREHLRDTQQVATLEGCIGDRVQAGDFMIRLVMPEYAGPGKHRLTREESLQLDSLILFTPNSLASRYDALNRAGKREQWYIQIRSLVTEEHNLAALVPLAAYQKYPDLKLIRSIGERKDLDESGQVYVFEAIQRFSNPEFLPFLQQKLEAAHMDPHWDRYWSSLYAAIAGYQNEQALVLFQFALDSTAGKDNHGDQAGLVFQAVRTHRAPIYDGLLLRLWSADRTTSWDVFAYLALRYPGRSDTLIERDLTHADDLFDKSLTQLMTEPGGSEKLCSAMLDTLARRNPVMAVQIIQRNILHAGVYAYMIFGKKAAMLRDISFVEPLFQRLQMDDNPNICLNAAEALLAYEDKSINQRILRLRQSVKALQTGWGSAELEKLLKARGLE